MDAGSDREHRHARRLRTAPLEVVGRFADASNATLLVRLTDRDARGLDEVAEQLGREPELSDLEPDDLAVYKPQRGERPLRDFPKGTLHRREIAAALVNDALGWGLVPATVEREDAPFGVGSLQRYVAHDPQEHYFSLLEAGEATVRAQLEAMVVFDLIIDNADRKAGHVLVERPPGAAGEPADGATALRLVDHGVSFHVEPKLRTVAWDFAGQPVPTRLLAELEHLPAALDAELGARLAQLLSAPELERLRERIGKVRTLEAFPEPEGPFPYPWPLL
ncbi:MAG: SCO1664 family protein [Nitriliruptoraceae bacterium]